MRQYMKKNVTSVKAFFNHPDTEGKNLFLDLGQCKSNRINLLLDRINKEQCRNIISRFTQNYIETKRTTKSKG